MNAKIILLCAALLLYQNYAQLIPSPWIDKTRAEIEEIIDNVVLHGPTVI